MNSFLDGSDARKNSWRDDGAAKHGIRPMYRWTGPGMHGLEVVFGEADSEPRSATVREVWKGRHGRGAAPLLLVVGFGERAIVCGAAGDEPPVVALELGHAERLAESALREPHRQLAVRRVSEAMEGWRGRASGASEQGAFGDA